MANDLQTRTMRRVSLRIVPFIMLPYFVSFIDRVNIGFAALTMNKDLGFSPSVYGFGAGIFFWGYFLFEVPSNVILDKVGARLWIARVMISWSLVSGAMAFVQGQTSFYVLRFLLGAAEAGFFPGIILYLSYWFPARQRASVTALFMAAAPLSTVLGSPVSSALLEMHGLLGLQGWQWLFLIEALPAILLGFAVLGFMTDRPEQAKWLADDERAWLAATMNAERASRLRPQTTACGAVSRICACSRSRWSISARRPASTRSASGRRRSSRALGSPTWRSASSMPSRRRSRSSPCICGPGIPTAPMSGHGMW